MGPAQLLVTVEELLDLDDIVGQRFGRRVDGGQAAADDHDRHPDLEVGQALGLRRPGELEGHEEVGRLADASGQAVLHRDDRRPARPHAEGDVVEAHVEGLVDRQSPAESDAAEHGELPPALEQEPDDLEEVLVPADGDPVLGHPAEARHHPAVERLVDVGDVADRPERVAGAEGIDPGERLGQRLDLEAVDGDDGVAVVHQVVRQREPGRPQADDQDLAAGRLFGIWAGEVQRIPPGQQAVDLEAQRQFEDVLERPGLDLRDVDRLLLLVDAGLHAVVADPVAGRRAHRVVDRDDGQGTDGVAVPLQRVHLGDLLFERAAGQRHAEGALLERPVLLLQAGRAAILVLVVALDAVPGLVERPGEVGAGVGQVEPLAVPAVLGEPEELRRCRAISSETCGTRW